MAITITKENGKYRVYDSGRCNRLVDTLKEAKQIVKYFSRPEPKGDNNGESDQDAEYQRSAGETRGQYARRICGGRYGC
jgi:hypothetical protein